MQVLLSYLGAALSFILLLVSASMNWRFGYALGSEEIDKHIYGIASASADGFKAVLPFFIALLLLEKRKIAVMVGCFAWLVCTGYSLTSAIGFSALNRTETTGVRERSVSQVAQAQDDLKVARAKLKKLPAHRSAGVIKADLNAKWQTRYRYEAKRVTLKELTDSCAEPVGPKTVSACSRISVLKQELAVANSEAALRKQIADANQVIDTASGLAVAGTSDPQVAIFAKLFDLEEGTIRTVLIILVAVLVEVGSGSGFFLSLGLGRNAIHLRLTNYRQPAENLAKQFFIECVDRVEHSNAGASELHDAYNAWLLTNSGGANKPMTQTAFGRWMSGQGFEKIKINGRYHYLGLTLRDNTQLCLVN